MSSGCSRIRYMICCFSLFSGALVSSNVKHQKTTTERTTRLLALGKRSVTFSPFKKNAHTRYFWFKNWRDYPAVDWRDRLSCNSYSGYKCMTLHILCKRNDIKANHWSSAWGFVMWTTLWSNDMSVLKSPGSIFFGTPLRDSENRCFGCIALTKVRASLSETCSHIESTMLFSRRKLQHSSTQSDAYDLW